MTWCRTRMKRMSNSLFVATHHVAMSEVSVRSLELRSGQWSFCHHMQSAYRKRANGYSYAFCPTLVFFAVPVARTGGVHVFLVHFDLSLQHCARVKLYAARTGKLIFAMRMQIQRVNEQCEFLHTRLLRLNSC